MKLNKEIQRLWNVIARTSAVKTPVGGLTAQMRGSSLNKIAPDSPIDHLPTLKQGQQIGLFLGSELSPSVMHYVITTCIRLSPKLTVLTFQSESDAHALLKPYQAELADAHIGVQLTVLGGEPPAALIQALRKRPEIAFLVCNELGYLGRSLKKGVVRKEAFSVPVVTIGSETGSANPAQGGPAHCRPLR